MSGSSSDRAVCPCDGRRGPSPRAGPLARCAAADGFRGVRFLEQALGAAGAAQRSRNYEVLDAIDFGGGCKAGVLSDLGQGPANAGRLLLLRSQAIKDRRKRWHDDKTEKEPASEARLESSRVLAGHLASKQPAVSAIVVRCTEAGAASPTRIVASRRYVRAACRA